MRRVEDTNPKFRSFTSEDLVLGGSSGSHVPTNSVFSERIHNALTNSPLSEITTCPTTNVKYHPTTRWKQESPQISPLFPTERVQRRSKSMNVFHGNKDTLSTTPSNAKTDKTKHFLKSTLMLADITNLPCATTCFKKQAKGKIKCPVPDKGKRLFHDEENSEKDKDDAHIYNEIVVASSSAGTSVAPPNTMALQKKFFEGDDDEGGDGDRDGEGEREEYSKVAGDTSNDDDMFYEEDIVEDDDSCEQNLADCMSSQPHYQSNSVNVPREYKSLGAPTCTCEYCGAVMWKEERVNKGVTRGKPKFSLCCSKGKIQLPRPPPTPEFLLNLYNDKAKDQLLIDIKQKKYFGKCVGVMYVVEFQKRGLPHVHMLVWLDAKSKTALQNNVDKYVSAEIPDPLKDPNGYAAVKQFMIHGPCGREFNKSPCMKDFKCVRHFPKKYCPRTFFDESGFPVYMRRKTPYNDMVDDILYIRRRLTGNNMLLLNTKQQQFFALAEIHKLLKSIGKSLMDFKQLPQPPATYLQQGDSNIPTPSDGLQKYLEDDIRIPSQFCISEGSNTIDSMISSTFPDFLQNFSCPKYLRERAKLTPTNQTVGHINSLIVDKIPGEAVSYFSIDEAADFGGTEVQKNAAFPIEYLNSISIAGMPPHDLKLKVGVVVMLIRNLNQTLGLCNGTRMVVSKCLKNCIECEVICGTFLGTRHFIPRMELCPTDSRLPFKLIRKQLPIQICYAMTINKSQGQSLERVALFLPNSVFSHGQLYVAISRVTSPEGLKIFIDSQSGKSTDITPNVVFKEVFYNLPKA
ncbi:hypothetical protein POM88_047304 [Heracleum sosnowskyi]|uniref:ATP-dependent DNA helicase n=1 Tax=Heracleum sosnowskyi TaxID=360622 RepID=A0AAD8LZD4_9APIA|nr:hypothetical protein POM88_047304 [Heracleum sosnowskyi]